MTTGTSLSSRSVLQDREAVHVGQPEVEDHEVGLLTADKGQALCPGRGGHDPISLVAKADLDEIDDARLVVDDRDERR